MAGSLVAGSLVAGSLVAGSLVAGSLVAGSLVATAPAPALGRAVAPAPEPFLEPGRGTRGAPKGTFGIFASRSGCSRLESLPEAPGAFR
ncbi:MAG: hypothetical protein CSA24_00860 [Deltaproteobacteria bacterium]|nr:MAG: hypothetical protein CSA24_00860 [Deltaproteobacteria bacterium]